VTMVAKSPNVCQLWTSQFVEMAKCCENGGGATLPATQTNIPQMDDVPTMPVEGTPRVHLWQEATPVVTSPQLCHPMVEH